MTVRTRFAPSPTGFLHIGGARTALYNWLYAKKNGGSFVLRVEDTDAARSTDDSAKVILDGLKWLGLEWDEGPGVEGKFGPYFQSQRQDIYDAYLEKLQKADLVYEDEGATRFRVPDKDMVVHDRICGDVAVNLKTAGSKRFDEATKQEVEANPDIVIRRPDGSYIFHFVNVVDDIEMKISHVIRGEDHLSNTPKHLALFEAFGVAPPIYAHIPLNLNPSGTKMSKRDQGALIHEYVQSGFLGAAVNNYMALLGWSSGDDQEVFSPEELLEKFDLSGVNKANSKFDFKKCLWVNGEHIRSLSIPDLQTAAAPFLESAGIDADDPRLLGALELARERAQLLSEIPPVIEPVFSADISITDAAREKLTGHVDIAKVCSTLVQSLTEVSDWSVDAIKAGINNAAESMEVKMGKLMLPCRVAVTGATSGADLVPMMVLIGKETTLQRIENLPSLLGG